MSKKTKKYLLIIVLIILGFIYEMYIEEPLMNYLNSLENETQPAISLKKNTNTTGELVIHYIDVGQADSILITCDDQNMLIDAGNNEDGPKLVNYFNDLGITKFDYVVGTHAHEDHIGGIDDIINNFSVDKYYMPDVVTTSKTFEDVIVALENNNLALSIPVIGDKFSMSEANFEVIFVGDDESDLNNTSIVLRLDYGNTSFLFTGDATGVTEKKILDSNIDVDVLKVGHHGSQYSSTLDFLNKVTPKYAVISVGKNNKYDHPKKVIINRFEYLGIEYYRTDLDGTIIAKSDGKTISFSKEVTDTNG